MDGELNMSMFDNNFELNISPDDFSDYTENEETENTLDSSNDDILDNTNDTIENDNSEEVDSEDDQSEGDDSNNESESSSNLYSSLTKVIYEQGLLPSLDIENTKIESVDDFVNAFKIEQEKQAQLKLEEYISNLDVNQIAQSKQTILDLESITIDSLSENLDLAKKLIYQDYLNQGLDEKKATRMVARSVDLGEDTILEDAEESLKSLKEFENRKIEFEKENYKIRLEEDRVAQEKMDLELKNKIYNTKDLIKGLKPSKALQDKVYKSINDIVGKSPDGIFENKFMRERRENPIDFETRMYHIYELTNGFKDYSKLETSAKSNAVKDLESIVRKSKTLDNGTPLWAQDKNSYFGNGHVLNI